MGKRFVWCPQCEKPIENGCDVHSGAPANRAPFVIPDTLPYPKKIVSLHGMPVCESNSDIKRAMKRHDEKHGTRLFQP